MLLILLLWFWFCLPDPLFNTPASTVLLDKNGKLLAAKIADDGQWRFPYSDSIPLKFKQAIIQFEDRKYIFHPGVNPLSLFRAALQNWKAKKISSGGSTLTMQTIRLSRRQKSRTFSEKLIEIILSCRLELTYSKNEILSLYASQAPFGGNVVGLEAASWRYFGRNSSELSWSESATLAVLPNSPSLIYPGKNHEKLKKKRDRLLQRLMITGIIDTLSCQLAQSEPLPLKPFPLPQLAPHLLTRAMKEGLYGKIIHSTLEENLQERVSEIVERHHRIFKHNEIHNAAALVLEVETGNALAYVGNTFDPKAENANDVDIITAPRSTGSILKPFLLSALLNEGEILADHLIQDVPMQLGGFSPKNYNLQYDGAVPAKRAISRSLNVPSVKMLQDFGTDRFLHFLKKIGMTTMVYPADHYGLSIILGGGEGTLWNIAGIYASMGRTLNHFTKYNSRYIPGDFHQPFYINVPVADKAKKNETEENSTIDAASIWLTFESMVEVARPDEETNWQYFSSLGKIAWKTGTSFGSRDGWAIGCTPQHIVAVWVGNANGEGRPGLTGIGTAAPIMLDIFNLLRTDQWFYPPYDEMSRVELCRQSGFRAQDICETKDSVWIQNAGLKTSPCPYHKLIHLDNTSEWQVNSDCESSENMIHRPWFILPPVQEWFYKSKNPSYSALPPFRADCKVNLSIKSMELIYPKKSNKILIPVELDGGMGKTVFEAAHRNSKATIFWHIDNEYIGNTVSFHQMAMRPEIGKHILTLIDENGESLVQPFEIVGKKINTFSKRN